MAGITGAWNKDGRPVSAGLIEAMAAKLSHRGPDGKRTYVHGAFGSCVQVFLLTPESHADEQPCRSRDGVIVLFDGRLDNRDELDTEGHSAKATDVEFAANAYRRDPERFPAMLKGDFALVVFDERERRLILARDPLGGATLNYALVGKSVLFASEAKALLAHPELKAEPDEDMLAEFLFRGADLRTQSSTFFKGIQTIPPGHALEVTEQGTSLRKYWDFDAHAKIRYKSPSEYAERYRELFFSAVKRRLRSRYPVAITVSGGIDSSSIYCTAMELARQGAVNTKIVGIGFSTDYAPADERHFVNSLAEKYGSVIQDYPLPENGLHTQSDGQSWYSEAPALELNIFKRMKDDLAQQGVRLMLSGFFGDQLLLSPAYIVDLITRFRWLTARKHLREYFRWYGPDAPFAWEFKDFIGETKGFLLPEAVRPFYRRIRRALVPSRPEIPIFSRQLHERAWQREHESQPVYVPPGAAYKKALFHQVRSRKHALSMEIEVKLAAMHGLTLSCPFRDVDLIAFLFAIPPEVAYLDGIPRWIHREAMKGILPEALRARRTKGDYTVPMNRATRHDAEKALLANPDSAAARRGYLAPAQEVRQQLETLRKMLQTDRVTAQWVLGDLMGLEDWLTAFWRDTIERKPHRSEANG